MTNAVEQIGVDWLLEQNDEFTDHIIRLTPSEHSERYRVLSKSESSFPGPYSWDVNPYMREIVDCFDIDSPIREVNVMKGVKVTYTTVLESGLFYYMHHVKNLPIMYVTADKELSNSRVENNFLVMLKSSGLSHIIQSSDIDNKRKTGKTKNQLQWEGGGYLIPEGAKNAAKMRQYSIAVLLKDELDGWAQTIGNDGDPDSLTDDRCAAYEPDNYKIFRGSTPLLAGVSKIKKQFLRGDQRLYNVRCLKCGFLQPLRWTGVNDAGKKYGVVWDFKDNGLLDIESVRYLCKNCQNPHLEFDKEKLYDPNSGAKWVPTAEPLSPEIRSYHLPGYYSPAGMRPWWRQVGMYLEAWDDENKQIKDYGKFQVFYNNVLGEPFTVLGDKVSFVSVSSHRRDAYSSGVVPNVFAEKFAGSRIKFLTCQVDVHKRFLAVAVMGWTVGARCFVIDYFRIEDEAGCENVGSAVWGKLRSVIEENNYLDENGESYGIELTLIDAGWSNDTVVTFCADYESGVVPILGRERTAKNQRIKEFAEFTTQSGTTGFRILVDHYKDRLAPVLRREWVPNAGLQPKYHFNAPVNMSDVSLAELTVERRKKEVDARGNVSYRWIRPGNARNELWDLLVYGHAAVEIMAWSICVKFLELEAVDWSKFWDYWDSENKT